MATKIQVRRDTTTNWTTYGAEVPAAGEFCYDTDLKTLKIGDGVTAYRDLNVIADADFDATEINDNYVAVTGDNMTGPLTIGPDGGPAVTTLAANGTATFTNTVIADGPDSAAVALLVRSNYTAGTGNQVFLVRGNTDNDIAWINGDGNATFAGVTRIGDPDNADPTSSAASGVRISNAGLVKIKKSSGGGALSVVDENNDTNASIGSNGNADFVGSVTVGTPFSAEKIGLSAFNEGALSIYHNDRDSESCLQIINTDGGNTTPSFIVQGDGSAEFAGNVNAEAALDINKGGSKDGNNSALVVWSNSGSTPSVDIKGNGSATFAGNVVISGSNPAAAGVNAGCYFQPGGVVQATRASGAFSVWEGYATGNPNPTSTILSNGAATFATVNGASVVLNLEPDNDANYVSTTDSEGNETRVYNGPTLDVKTVIQELQQRVADRDAVIADFSARLAALEADHTTLMGNSNGGY